MSKVIILLNICIVLKLLVLILMVFFVGINGVILCVILWWFCVFMFLSRLFSVILRLCLFNLVKWWCVCFLVVVVKYIFNGVLGNIIVFILWLLVIKLFFVWNVCWWCNNVFFICGKVVIFDVVVFIFLLWIVVVMFLFFNIIFDVWVWLLIKNCIFKFVVSGINVFLLFNLIWWWSVVSDSIW